MSKIDPRYATSVTVTGGREGHAVSDDGVLDVQLRRPKLNGTPEGTNPEQLFAAAWGACFQGAMSGVARETGDDISQSVIKVHIALGTDSEGKSGLAGKIEVHIPGMEQQKAQELIDKAHENCPYSRVTRGNIDVDVVAI
jgi:osmotically inducible protein OsmC